VGRNLKLKMSNNAPAPFNLAKLVNTKKKSTDHSYSSRTLHALRDSFPNPKLPSCFSEEDCNSEDGKWNPIKWINRVPKSHKNLKQSEHHSTSSDDGDDIANDDLKLQPQRRSFITGCHVEKQSKNGNKFEDSGGSKPPSRLQAIPTSSTSSIAYHRKSGGGSSFDSQPNNRSTSLQQPSSTSFSKKLYDSEHDFDRSVIIIINVPPLV